MQAIIDRPAATPQTTKAIDVIQQHLDREARNRRQEHLRPAELCPMQKAELVQELVGLLR